MVESLREHREFLDGAQPFEQGSPRPSEVAGGFSVGNPEQRGRADGGVGLLRLPPRMLQKIIFHGGKCSALVYLWL